MKLKTGLAACALGAWLAPGAALAQPPPLLPEPVVAALASEISGEAARRNLEAVARQHRMRGSRGFHLAAEHILAELKAAGLDDARIERFPADGETFYGTQKARPAWDAEFAELWELRDRRGRWERHARRASWDAMPVTLAQDSESAEVTASLVDVGEGTAEDDYAGKDVRGRLVLAAAQPGEVAPLAVERFGAAGIISYAQNQRSAWWGEDESLVRWGHLDSFAAMPTFAFMVSLEQARSFRERLAAGEDIRLQAIVRAGRRPGSYEIVTATIPGSDPERTGEEIAFSCHLDHQRPGANDNASGCVTILEVARTLAKLVREERIAPPARTLRFIWPPEIEGTLVLLNARPELAARIKAVVHLDMVGGDPAVTKAVIHVTRGPASLPSFVNDVAEAFGAFVNRESAAFADTGRAAYPLVAPEGGQEGWQARLVEFTLGSDHQIYTDSSFGIPAIYLNDWPDRYIHTNFDRPANIDPTKLKRAAFVAAASGYFLSRMGADDVPALVSLLEAHALRRTATMLERRAELPADEAAGLARFHVQHERALVDSIDRFVALPAALRSRAHAFVDGLADLAGPIPPAPPASGDGRLLFARSSDVKGPMSVFGYDYLVDHYGADRVRALRLLRFEGRRGSGSEYAYDALNLADGRRTAQEIRDALSAVYGPVPLEFVIEYLRALESIGVVHLVR